MVTTGCGTTALLPPRPGTQTRTAARSRPALTETTPGDGSANAERCPARCARRRPSKRTTLSRQGARDRYLDGLSSLAGALSAFCPPPASVLAVYEADPALAELSVDLPESPRLAVSTAIMGARHR